MSITMEWVSRGFRSASEKGPRSVEMVRPPRQGDRVVRVWDGKRFDVAHVTRIEGGELHFAFRGEDGERVSACVEDLFPALGTERPFRSLS